MQQGREWGERGEGREETSPWGQESQKRKGEREGETERQAEKQRHTERDRR